MLEEDRFVCVHFCQLPILTHLQNDKYSYKIQGTIREFQSEYPCDNLFLFFYVGIEAFVIL